MVSNNITNKNNSNIQPEDDTLNLLIRSNDEILINTKKSKRHSALVRRMRLILPISALAIIAILMTWTNKDTPLAPIPREQVSPQTISHNELINPKFQSEDSSNQPYTITADKATQNAEDMNSVQLQKPVADMTLKTGGWVSLKATNGTYKQTEGNLNLNGQVEMHHDSGYELHTEKMNIDVKEQTITSDTDVRAHGPAADISATGLTASGTTDTVIFNGPAKLILRKPSPAPASAPAPDLKKEN